MINKPTQLASIVSSARHQINQNLFTLLSFDIAYEIAKCKFNYFSRFVKPDIQHTFKPSCTDKWHRYILSQL